MPEIDKLLNNMARNGIQYAAMVSGQPTRLIKDGKEGQSSAFDLVRLMNLAREVVPPADRARLADKYDQTLPYATSDGFFSLRIQRKKQALQVEAWFRIVTPALMLAPQGNWNPLRLRRPKELLNLVEDVALSRDGKRLASAAGDTIDTWDSESGRHLEKMYSPPKASSLDVYKNQYVHKALSVEFSPDDQTLCGGVTGGCLTWSVSGTAHMVPTLSQEVRDLAFLPQNTGVAYGTGGTSGMTQQAESTEQALAVATTVASLAFGTPNMDVKSIPEGSVGLSHISPTNFRLWNKVGNTSHQSGKGVVDAVAVSADGRYLLSGDNWSTVRVFDLDQVSSPKVHAAVLGIKMTNSPQTTLPRHCLVLADGVRSVSCAATGALALASCRHELVLLNFVQGSVVWRQRGTFGKSLLSRHGDRVFVASGSILYVLSARDGSQVEEPFHLPATVSSVTTSRDGRTLACGCGDGSLHVWRLW